MGTICRLCFNDSGVEFEVIDDVTKDILDVLLMKMELDDTENPVMCHNCAESVKKFLDFKSILLGTEKSILSYTLNKQDIKFDINDIFKNSKCVNTIKGYLDVCRFCTNQTDRSDLVPIQNIKNEAFLMGMLPLFVPEMDFNIIKDAVACLVCRGSLESYIMFVNTYLDMEEKRKKNNFGQDRQIENCGRSKLGDILQNFLSKCALKVSGVNELNNKEFDLAEDPEFAFGMNTYQNPSIVTTEKDDINHPVKINSNNHFKKLKCALCSYETKYKKCLNKHILKHKHNSEVEWHKCTSCAYQTKYKHHLKTHMIRHKDISEIVLHKCTLCTYETKNKYYLTVHMLVHKDISEVEKFQCKFCGYQTKYRQSLKKHILKHKDISEVKLHKCTLCAYEARYKYYLTRHMIRHMENAEAGLYKCTACDYETKYKKHFDAHLVVHKNVSEVELFKCGTCTYKTKYKRCLMRHVLIHRNDIEMHKCTICTYETRNKYYLKLHALVHKERELMYNCAMCPFKTKYKKTHSKHMASHI